MYARITDDGHLKLLTRVPNVSNATDAHLAAYAAEKGYKPCRAEPRPGPDFQSVYQEDDAVVYLRWKQVHKWYKIMESDEGAYYRMSDNQKISILVSDSQLPDYVRCESFAQLLSTFGIVNC